MNSFDRFGITLTPEQRATWSRHYRDGSRSEWDALRLYEVDCPDKICHMWRPGRTGLVRERYKNHRASAEFIFHMTGLVDRIDGMNLRDAAREVRRARALLGGAINGVEQPCSVFRHELRELGCAEYAIKYRRGYVG